tara:strand:+ start:439 stop:648 length:210 start_codon:yes stop_codon:yes gene_type:complete
MRGSLLPSGPVYLYLILHTKIKKLNIRVIVFANIIGTDEITTPYINQQEVPIVKIKNMYKEISFVLFDL